MLLKLKKNRKGFTLIELMVVVAILAILAAIAIPSIIGLQDKAKDSVLRADAATIASAINVHNAATVGTKIDSKPAIDVLHGDLTDDGENFDFTITGSAADEETAAYALVTVTAGVATFTAP